MQCLMHGRTRVRSRPHTVSAPPSPLLPAAFAKATGQLAKPDALDAPPLAHVAEAVRPTPEPRPDAQVDELRKVAWSSSEGAKANDRRGLVFGTIGDHNRVILDLQTDVTRARLWQG